VTDTPKDDRKKHDKHAAAEESAPSGRSSRRRHLGVIVAGVALVAVVGYAVLGARHPAQTGRHGAAPGEEHPIPVGAAAVTSGDLDVYLDGLGTVIPASAVTVHTRIDGQLMKVEFREGGLIKAGAPLAEIDPRPYEVQLVEAQGQMARDEALLKNAQLDLQRFRTLYAQDSIARQQLDTQESLVRQYQGTVQIDQGQIDNAQLQLSYCHITAPISGRLGLRQVDPGNMVHATDTNGIVVITQQQPIDVVFPLPETDLAAVLRPLRAGAALPVEAWDRDDKTLLASGTLLTVDNQIDTTTGTVKLKARFANQDNALFPNQFVNARVKVDTLHGVTLMPTAAVQRGTPGTFVYLVKPDNTVTVRPVKLGASEGLNVVVTDGLAPGDRVVTDGADKLREGTPVEAVMSGSNTAPAGAAKPASQRGRHRKEAAS
jgi:multidrug efflux system membrane fusion protein